ncbi:hypothetical protein [Metasolibacillus meyeri]|uniref:hypothetical protein n=1 Tax=Metasolibacillus meyeri TaxID=1071052 RepID=UPI000D30815B|nr:hypothetical protein [Metasolibacillus meyeri]
MERFYQGELKIDFKMSIDSKLDDEMNNYYSFHHPESLLLDEISALIESKGYVLITGKLAIDSKDETKIYTVDRSE